MPNRNPAAAGSTLHLPLSATVSMAGISNDHTEVATITPEAKPNSVFCTRGDRSSFMKKTNAAPSMVPKRGMRKPIIRVMRLMLYLIMYCQFWDKITQKKGKIFISDGK